MSKMKIIVVFLLWIFLIGLSPKHSFCQGPDPRAVEGLSKATPLIIDASNRFAFDLYAHYSEKDENLFFSSYSISTAMAMVYEGAKGETASEIQKVFYFPDDINRREAYLSLITQLNRPDLNYSLTTANSLWAQKDYPFLPEYFKLIEQFYNCKATNMDFAGKPEESRQTINRWVEEKTYSRIKDIIPPGFLNEMTRLVLTNTIYFKGKWSKPFKKSVTYPSQFHITEDRAVTTPFMNLREDFYYAETEDLQILELPYQGSDLSMLVILPKAHNLREVEEMLNPGMIDQLKEQFNWEKVEVAFPKFKFETKYLMKSDLSKMGMPTAFTVGQNFGGKADFSGMTGQKDLHIDEVIHQTFVEVDEEGTEAAAATAMIMKSESISIPEEPKIFKADRPFIFIIQERQSGGQIFFMGRLMDPTQEKTGF